MATKRKRKNKPKYKGNSKFQSKILMFYPKSFYNFRLFAFDFDTFVFVMMLPNGVKEMTEEREMQCNVRHVVKNRFEKKNAAEGGITGKMRCKSCEKNDKAKRAQKR